MAHEGAVINSAGHGVYYVGARNNWYPSRDGVFSTYDLKFRYPNNLQMVSTGDVVEDRVEGEWRLTQRRVSVPIRFAGFNLGGDYEKASVTRAGFTIDVYANRGGRVSSPIAAQGLSAAGSCRTASAEPPSAAGNTGHSGSDASARSESQTSSACRRSRRGDGVHERKLRSAAA